MKKLFLSGPITGLPNDNFGQFNDAATVLRNIGYIVIIPHELFIHEDVSDYTHEDYCNKCCSVIAGTRGVTVVQLAGWQNSKGAAKEKAICDLLNIPIKSFNEIIDEKTEQY